MPLDWPLSLQLSPGAGCQYDGKEADYRGSMSKTVSGRTCQRWDVQSPHPHSRTADNLPGRGLGPHNSCRNPDDESG